MFALGDLPHMRLWDRIRAFPRAVRVQIVQGLAFCIQEPVELCILAALHQNHVFRAFVRHALVSDLRSIPGDPEECANCKAKGTCDYVIRA